MKSEKQLNQECVESLLEDLIKGLLTKKQVCKLILLLYE